MASPTTIQKLEREIKSKFEKASDQINLIMAIKMERKLILKIKDSLTNLKAILEEIEKLKNNARLEIKKIKYIAKKELKEVKTEKINKLENLDEKLRLKT